MNENEIIFSDINKGTDSFMNLTLSELNQYLPALRKSDDIYKDKEKLDDGLFLTDVVDGLSRLPDKSIDLIIANPPSNLFFVKNKSKTNMTLNEYYQWNKNWLAQSKRILKSTGAIYLFCDWKKSSMYHSFLGQYFFVQSRITWKKQFGLDLTNSKGWKNVISDIWFATNSEEFLFNGEVINSKIDSNYSESEKINFWSDIFGKDNLQKVNDEIPSEVIERIFDVSSFKLSWIVDPFVNYGLTGVIAKKMGRRFIGFDTEQDRLLMAMKRIDKT